MSLNCKLRQARPLARTRAGRASEQQACSPLSPARLPGPLSPAVRLSVGKRVPLRVCVPGAHARLEHLRVVGEGGAEMARGGR